MLDIHKLPTNSQYRKLDVLTPMATALYEQLRKKKSMSMEDVKKFIKTKEDNAASKHGTPRSFAKYLQNVFTVLVRKSRRH